MDLSHYQQSLMNYLPHLVSAAVILIIGFVVATVIKRSCGKWFNGGKNKTVKVFISNVLYTIIIVLTLITVLAKLGVPTASLVAIMGAASLAIGFALRDFLANIAAGFVIVMLRPFKIGDFIEVNGSTGTITNINLFLTELRSSTNEGVFIPNGKVFATAIVNKSWYKQRRLDLTIGIDYTAKITTAKDAIQRVLNDSSLVEKDPAPIIAVNELADSSVNLLIRVWVKRDDLLSSQWTLLEAIKDKLDQENINIPFPQIDVHFDRDSVPN